VDNISTAIHLLCWEGVFFFFFFGVEAAGLFRATEQLLLSASFSKGMDGWTRKKTLNKKMFRFLVVFFLPPRLCQTAPSLPWGFIFFPL
jgi:hypothetical protein